jgi:hypothetical protein
VNFLINEKACKRGADHGKRRGPDHKVGGPHGFILWANAGRQKVNDGPVCPCLTASGVNAT